MTKHFYICLIFLLLNNFIAAQNLVVNSGFESYSICPSSFSSIDYAIGWSSSGYFPPVTGTADYYHKCANGINFQLGVPNNLFGYQQAASGFGYAGFLGYGSFASSLSANCREFCVGILSTPLTIGVRYYVSFKIVRANKTTHAINHIGARFHNSYTIQLVPNNNPQIFTNNIVSDTLNWTTIQGSFIADSNYTYVYIGTHFFDSSVTLAQMQTTGIGQNAYYFVDDVCVSTDSLTCIIPDVLPVDFISFKVEPYEKRNALINWMTGSEINNDYFIIEKSVNLSDWETVAKINGAGNSSTNLSYHYIDVDPFYGLSYYRLKQVDFDGSFAYSNVQKLLMDFPYNISVSPNPASENVTIRTKELINLKLELYNEMGILVKTHFVERTSQFSFDLSDLSSGIYLLIFMQDGVAIKREKLAIENR